METKKYIIKGSVAVTVLALVGFGLYKLMKNRKTGNSTQREEKKLTGMKIHYGSEGYVNVRSSPRVDNENYGAFDFSHNLIGQVDTNPVGTIMERTKGEDGYFWYKVKLTRPLNGKTEGYVREDAVVVQH